MKVSKTLLKTIAIGLTIGAASACGYLEDINNVEPNHGDDGTQQCTQAVDDPKSTVYNNCPACGMG